MGREGGREAWQAALVGVGDSVILDVLLHLSPSPPSLCECCGCVPFVFSLSYICFPQKGFQHPHQTDSCSGS